MKFFIEVEQGQVVPRGYGYCWQNYARMTATVAPIPLNIILRFLNGLWYAVQLWNQFPDLRDLAYREGHRIGRDAGWRSGEQKGYRWGQKKFKEDLDRDHRQLLRLIATIRKK